MRKFMAVQSATSILRTRMPASKTVTLVQYPIHNTATMTDNRDRDCASRTVTVEKEGFTIWDPTRSRNRRSDQLENVLFKSPAAESCNPAAAASSLALACT